MSIPDPTSPEMPEGKIGYPFIYPTSTDRRCQWCGRSFTAGRRVRRVGEKLFHARCVSMLARMHGVELP